MGAFTAGYRRKDPLSVLMLPLLLFCADTSAFTRAFRRWTGVTPAAFRRAAASAC